jgi:hypothetical protein
MKPADYCENKGELLLELKEIMNKSNGIEEEDLLK